MNDRICIANMSEANSSIFSIPRSQIQGRNSNFMNVGKSAVQKIMHYRDTKSVNLPKPKMARETFLDLFDDLSRRAVRMHIRRMWLSRQIPTIYKIHQAVSDDNNLPLISKKNLLKLLKDLGFRYSKISRSKALTEKNKIIRGRREYLRHIKKYREEGRHIYYMDEIMMNAGVCIAVALHIGSEEDGFVPGGLLYHELKNNYSDCRVVINEEAFYQWMENILPLLPDNSIIVMDNAPYHSVMIDEAPTWTSKIDDIKKWLYDKGELIETPMVRVELMQLVERIKPRNKKYVIEELAQVNGKTILRLPRDHHELNPMVLAWSEVKNHVSYNMDRSDLNDTEILFREGIELVNTKVWKDFVNRTMEEENELWGVDFIIDEILDDDKDETVEITGDTSTSDFDTDSC